MDPKPGTASAGSGGQTPLTGGPEPAAPADVSTRSRRLRQVVRRIALAAAWLLAVAAIAFGAAGLVAATGARPGGERPELTSVGDAAIAPGLAAAEADLQDLRDRVDALGGDTRAALAALVATDRALLGSSVDDGTGRLDAIVSLTAAIRADLRALPGVAGALPDPLPPATELVLGPASRARWRAVDDALSATDRLPDQWARFTSGSIAAEQLTTLLIDHDAATAAAAKQGGAGRYAKALQQLDTSDRLTAEARALRDRLANTADVGTLTEWIERNATYDTALRSLYQALAASGGRVTDTVRAAFAAEQAARAGLPADTRALVVILSDLAQGGLNEVAIGIEEAKGRLDDAITALEVGARSSPGASGAP